MAIGGRNSGNKHLFPQFTPITPPKQTTHNLVVGNFINLTIIKIKEIILAGELFIFNLRTNY
jgi:hypothetical protein